VNWKSTGTSINDLNLKGTAYDSFDSQATLLHLLIIHNNFPLKTGSFLL